MKNQNLKIMKLTILIVLTTLFVNSCSVRNTSENLNKTDNLAKPSDIQYKWHEQERIMFVHFGPATWQGREYDNLSTPMDRISPDKLDTDQWCEVAQSWGAKEILFVAKHTGGFCWWQTETTNLGIKDTPYKNGKGDVLNELSESCKKYNLNLGVYIYPGDDSWGAGIGSGGITKDTSKQEAYNKVFRQQLTEVLANYGDIIEVWFDGSCKIDVSDILEKYAKNSVIFQGPHATLRWPGTESGKLAYPVWNAVKKEDMNTGVATQIHGDPNGDVWAPLETNTTLYDHYWFWSPEKTKKRLSLDKLMNCYYKSVGYGSVFLLNSSPDTTGLIAKKDMELYKAFGETIDQRFKTPLAQVIDKKGEITTLNLPETQKINHVVTMENYREGQRIREYYIEGKKDDKWIKLCSGSSVGRKKIDYFPAVEISMIRLKVLKSVGEPLIRSLSAYYVHKFTPPAKQELKMWSEWTNVKEWTKEMFVDGSVKIKVDLSDRINLPGQYSIRLTSDNKNLDIKLTGAEIHYEGRKALDEFVKINGRKISINRTAQVTDESSSVLYITINSKEPCNGKIEFTSLLVY